MLDPSTRLRQAIINDNLAVVSRLVRRFPDLLENIDPKNGWSSLHYAGYYGHYLICTYLVSKGHDTVEVSLDFEQRTPLHLAASKNHEQTVHFLAQQQQFSLRREDDETTQTSKTGTTVSTTTVSTTPSTPEMTWDGENTLASIKSRSRASSVLSNGSAKSKAKPKEEKMETDVSLERVLNWKDVRHQTALFVAAMHGHNPCVQLLLDFGADIDVTDGSGTRPIHMAAAYGHLKTIKTLIDRDADVATPNQDGWTPLQFCASKDIEDYFRALVAERASRHQQRLVQQKEREQQREREKSFTASTRTFSMDSTATSIKPMTPVVDSSAVFTSPRVSVEEFSPTQFLSPKQTLVSRSPSISSSSVHSDEPQSDNRLSSIPFSSAYRPRSPPPDFSQHLNLHSSRRRGMSTGSSAPNSRSSSPASTQSFRNYEEDSGSERSTSSRVPNFSRKGSLTNPSPASFQSARSSVSPYTSPSKPDRIGLGFVNGLVNGVMDRSPTKQRRPSLPTFTRHQRTNSGGSMPQPYLGRNSTSSTRLPSSTSVSTLGSIVSTSSEDSSGHEMQKELSGASSTGTGAFRRLFHSRSQILREKEGV
ncbi:Target of rapamycin complex 2 subunit AVO2 [Yarrowia sp. B02]|nr:Target of rapamycin complex 2 subunit AVO2 [Yarrowia sp. B02]